MYFFLYPSLILLYILNDYNWFQKRFGLSILNGSMSYIIVDYKKLFAYLRRKLVVEDKIIITDLMCFTSYNIMMYLYPLCIFIVLKNIESLPSELITANNLKFPREFPKIFLSYTVITVAALCQSLTTFFGYYFENNFLTWQWIVFGISQFYVPIWYFIPMLPIFFLLVWIEQFSRICKETEQSMMSLQDHAQKCLYYYNSIQNCFGVAFLCIFCCCQLFTFVNFFNVISFQFMDFDTWERSVFSVSFVLISLHLIFIVLSLTFTIEEALNSLKSLMIPMRKRLGKKGTLFRLYFYQAISVDLTELSERQEMLNLVEEIRDTGALTGHGYFEIRRANLTSMISISFTYLIILLQFRLS